MKLNLCNLFSDNVCFHIALYYTVEVERCKVANVGAAEVLQVLQKYYTVSAKEM